jgi:HNH endonuclease
MGMPGELTASVSLPLDVGSSVEIVPAYLRRALVKRDRHCRFPGCDQPAMACHPHHIVPRSEGGPTSLTNLLLLCSFHHLIAVHRWGWGIVLMPDGTVTATSPDKTQVLHSHGPPAQAA